MKDNEMQMREELLREIRKMNTQPPIIIPPEVVKWRRAKLLKLFPERPVFHKDGWSGAVPYTWGQDVDVLDEGASVVTVMAGNWMQSVPRQVILEYVKFYQTP